MKQAMMLFVFLALVIGGGSLIGVYNLPAEWYAALDKPPFNPPNWIFAPVWTLLYIFIAVAGWRTWRREPAGAAMRVWWAQLALNFVWSPVFFSLQSLGGALVIIVVLLASIAAFIALTRRADPVAALLFAPYAAWVSFATLLNASLFALN